MIYTSTVFRCIDNSGALLVKCIRILGKSPRCKGFPGDIAIISIKTCRAHRKVKAGEMHRAVLIRVGYRLTRRGNIIFQCTSNGAVILNHRELPLGSRVLEPVLREVRKFKHYKLLSLCPAVI